MQFLTSWQNFYMIIGTAAATLTGLMFISASLMVGVERQLTTLYAGVEAFNSPTVVHFCTALLAVTLTTPWQTFRGLSLLLGLAGLGLVIYFIRVMRRMRTVPEYQTLLRDWIWYGALPLGGYLVLIVAAFMLPTNPALAVGLISIVMVLLLTIGIRNAWDLVTYLAVERPRPNR